MYLPYGFYMPHVMNLIGRQTFYQKRPLDFKITIVLNNLETFKFGKQKPWGKMQDLLSS